MRNLAAIFVVFLAVDANAIDLVQISTNNGSFSVPRENILNGPDGVLKLIVHGIQTNPASLQPDGSIYVDVDKNAMKLALGYIRHGNVSSTELAHSGLLRNDFEYLFPGVVSVKKRKKQAKVARKKWLCAAYCDYKRENPVEFLSTVDDKLTIAWQNLVEICRVKGNHAYLVTQSIPQQDDYRWAMASMGTSCVEQSSQ